jgi:hypothetical protein
MVVEKRIQTPLGTLDLISAMKVENETCGGAKINTT